MPQITSKKQLGKPANLKGRSRRFAKNPKPQIPNPKKIPNGQIPRSEALSGVRYFRVFGIWGLEFGISDPVLLWLNRLRES